ncbi:MAG: transcription antitermination protein NusB [Actinobacteria bacterium]|nr:MAG: transcription antitermination protein NusB [Actinomycetota bacterium]
MRRSEQRRAAVVALYQHGLTGQSLDDALGSAAHPFTRALAHAALERGPELDALIERHSEHWALERIAPLERSIMRVALVEMLDPHAVPAEVAIPPEGAIDEAVQTAKVFCSADAPGFVNGILAAVLRELRDNGAERRDSPASAR